MNTLKTGALMALLTVLLVVAGAAINPQDPLVPATGALIFALVLNFAMYWFSDRIALAMAGAKELPEGELPELHRLVEEQAALARIPKPRVYLIQSDSPNAFATGRNPEHAAVAFTTGILRLLDREELAGVVAHELAHVKNRDTLIMAVAAAVAGAITYIGVMARWMMVFGGLGGRNRSGAPSAAIGLIGLLVVAIVLPLAALLIRLAISRAREFEADATGARLSGRPWALASALEKLEMGVRRRPLQVNEGISHLFIVNPLRGQSLANLFSTHPPIAERVRRLRRMAV